MKPFPDFFEYFLAGIISTEPFCSSCSLLWATAVHFLSSSVSGLLRLYF